MVPAAGLKRMDKNNSVRQQVHVKLLRTTPKGMHNQILQVVAWIVPPSQVDCSTPIDGVRILPWGNGSPGGMLSLTGYGQSHMADIA